MKSIIKVNFDNKKNDKAFSIPQNVGNRYGTDLFIVRPWMPRSKAEEIHENKHEPGRLAFH